MIKKAVLQQVVDKIDAAVVQIDIDGFPYFGVQDVFPKEYYDQLVEIHRSIEVSHFRPLSKNYSNRYVFDLNQGENNN